jgi:hypothetical protein
MPAVERENEELSYISSPNRFRLKHKLVEIATKPYIKGGRSIANTFTSNLHANGDKSNRASEKLKSQEATRAIRDVENNMLNIQSKRNKKENKQVKTFYKKPIFIVIMTVIMTLSAVYGAYRLHSHIYNQGYQDALKQQKAIASEVAKLSKQNQ